MTTPSEDPQQTPLPSWATRVLRGCVVLLCLGNAWMLCRIHDGMIGESALLSLVASPTDVGGFGFGESIGRVVCWIVGACFTVLAAGVLFTSRFWVTGSIAALQCLLVFAMLRTGSGYPPELVSYARDFASYLPIATQAIRVCSPVVLALAIASQVPRAALVARWAVALTFAGHGIEALVHYHAFVDMLIIAGGKFGLSLSQSSAETLLTIIGLVDVAAALLVVGLRWSPVAWYMAAWGLITAASRVVVKGWDFGWDGTATRMVHFALPLALALWWSRESLIKYKHNGQTINNTKDE